MGTETARAESSAPVLAPERLSTSFTAEAAEPAARLVWNPAWPRFRAAGYALTAASVTGALGATFLIPYPEEPRWVGGIMFDTAARGALHARAPGLRDGIRLASDFTLIAGVVQAGLIDNLLIPAVDGSWNVAWQLTLMNAQAFSLNILVATLLFKAVARARPTFSDCEIDGGSDPLCDSGSFASFPSSHTSTAFTAAGLTCIHHANLPLYGGEPWDTVACAGSLTIAVATGLFRVIGDRHYLSDVVLGAAFGFSLGYLYPYIFHYRYSEREWVPAPERASTLQWGIVPGARGTPLGLSVMGVF